MILTQGEKMVWAAAFVDALNESMRNSRGYPNNEACSNAVSSACGMVECCRRQMPEPGHPAYPGHPAMQMLRAMLGDEG